MRALLRASFAILLSVLSVGLAADELDLGAMSRVERVALANRLVAAGCYGGPVDGVITPALQEAVKVCPDQQPVLRIETGMHVSAIERIAVDAACKIAATGARDKTVRLWSLPDGHLIRTERLPIGADELGFVYAVAVSPDGSLVAVGGRDAIASVSNQHSVLLFDTATGDTIRNFGALPDFVHHIAFSSDGRLIALALGGHAGVIVFELASGRQVWWDTDYRARSQSIVFGPGDTLFATADDGYVRHYAADGKLLQRVPARGGARPFGLALDPSGERLAIGYANTPTVELFDAGTLESLGRAETDDLRQGNLQSVAWSSDGQRLYAAGGVHAATQGASMSFARVFNPNGRHIGADLPIANDSIFGLERCGEFIAFAAADPAFGLIGQAEITTLAASHAIDMRAKRKDAFLVSADGMQVEVGIGNSKSVVASLASGTVGEAETAIDGLSPPKTDGLPIDRWLNSHAPLFAGQPFAFRKVDVSRSLAVRADLTGFVLGTDGSLRAYDASGKLRWKRTAPSPAFAVNLARDGELVVAAYGDGTIRWHRWSDGQELLALFIDKDDRRFVAWTPTGYYMASPGAEDLIGWHVNRGWTQQADFFSASRFRDRFNRPEIVQAVLATLDEGEAVRQADIALKAAKARDTEARRAQIAQAQVTQAQVAQPDPAPSQVTQPDAAQPQVAQPEIAKQEIAKQEIAKAEETPLIASLPPVLRILTPSGETFGQEASGAGVTITYAIRSPSGLPVDQIDILVDGVRQTDRGFNRIDQPGAGETKAALNVHVPLHSVEVALIPHAGDIAGEPATIKLTYQGVAARGEDALKPKLYALVAGVSDYQDASLKLGYAAKDASDFGTTLQSQSGGLYEHVEVRLVTDHQATRANLLLGLKWLQQQVTSRDIGIVFLAGHGVVDAQQGYWFLPADATPETLEVAAVSQDDIRRTLNGLAGKAVLFLDSCHAAGAVGGTKLRGTLDINKVVSDFATTDNGVVAFASSTGREVSQERDEWHNGAFTKALIEGLSGKADLLHHETITLSELDAFVADRVKQLTDGAQHPVMTKPSTVPDYSIALVKQAK